MNSSQMDLFSFTRRLVSLDVLVSVCSACKLAVGYSPRREVLNAAEQAHKRRCHSVEPAHPLLPEQVAQN